MLNGRATEQLSQMFGETVSDLGTGVMQAADRAAGQFGFDSLKRRASEFQPPQPIVDAVDALLMRAGEDILLLTLLLTDREAAKRLWERFGIPQSPLAVPVFAQLSEQLAEAHRLTQTQTRETKQKLRETIEAVQITIITFYEAEIAKLEAERENYKQAGDEASQVTTVHGRMVETVGNSRAYFALKAKETARKIAELSGAQRAWLQLVANLTTPLMPLTYAAELEIAEAPDQSKAL